MVQTLDRLPRVLEARGGVGNPYSSFLSFEPSTSGAALSLVCSRLIQDSMFTATASLILGETFCFGPFWLKAKLLCGAKSSAW